MTRHEGRWVCWIAAGLLALLWILYIIQHMIGLWGQLPHGVATLFLAVEFTLGQIAINLGRPIGAQPTTQAASDRVEELVGRFVGLLEQNNAIVAEGLERAMQGSDARGYVRGVRERISTPETNVRRLPPRPPDAHD